MNIAADQQAEIDRLKREKSALVERLSRLELKRQESSNKTSNYVNKVKSHIKYYTKQDFKNLVRSDSGSEGAIFVGRLDDYGQIVLKEFMWTKEHPLDKYKMEIEILIEHRHPNIVQVYGILWDGVDKSRYLGYVMEHVAGGSLHNHIHDKKKSYDLIQICTWIEQIARGLQFLHRYGIIHRDIKPKNILVAESQVKLADFGIAKSFADASTTAGAGTFWYMAPETLNSGKSNPPTDIYSLAITIWEIFHRRQPYYELNNMPILDLIGMITQGVRPTVDPQKVDVSMQQFIESCWNENPASRPSIKSIVDYFEGKATYFNQLTGSTARNESQNQKIVPETSLEQSYVNVNTGYISIWDPINTAQKHDGPENLLSKIKKIVRSSGPKQRNAIMVVGGLKNNYSEYSGILILSSDRSKWIESQVDLPYRALGYGAVYLNEEIYFLGGCGHHDVLYKLDKNMLPKMLADMNIGRKGITNCCFVWKECIWVFGGADKGSNRLKSVERYDPKTNKWTLMPDMKYARSDAAAVLWNDKVIISGGYTGIGKPALNTNTVECFNHENGRWTELPNMPSFLNCHSFVSCNKKMIAIGGYDGETVGKNVWEMEGNSKWKPLPPMKSPSWCFSAIVLDKEIYAIGGNRGKGEECLDRVEIFDGKQWRDGPSLPYTMCDMSAMVVPQCFAERFRGCKS